MFDEGGVRTHASEEIAALTQRLRPLGHLATWEAKGSKGKAPEGFEPSTLRLLGVRSNQLSYGAVAGAGMRSAGAGCRLQTCRRGDPQRFNSAFPAPALGRPRALSSVEERPFRIREVEGSNPSVSTLPCSA